MRNPLVKRLPSEFKNELGKYIVIFLFMALAVSLVSGWSVAGGSMATAYDESFEKYNIEDGNFELYAKADDELIKAVEDSDRFDAKIYENFYVEFPTKEVDSTLRIFKKRTDINLECLMDGEFPSSDSEIAIDRMYADNNSLKVGDKLTLHGKEYRICGLVALSDYSALFSSPSDMMFDSIKFGVAIVTADTFGTYPEDKLHYVYSWKYADRPADNTEAKKLSEDFLEKLSEEAPKYMNAVTGYIPEYANQAIIFTGDDIKGDTVFVQMFLYIIVVIIAFIFAITTSNTIAKEAGVIGTLRATGYTKWEIVRHYLTLPMLVVLAGAVVGNILGYTVLKDYAASAYYGSYSLPTYVTLWNPQAFINTTVIPIIIVFIIDLLMLTRKLSLSPLQFIRHDLSRRKKKKAFRLNTRIGIMKRFRLRVLFQNMPNYIMMIIGALLGNVLVMFGLVLGPVLDNYQQEITSNLLADHQYLLKAQVETENKDAEKFSATTLKTIEGSLKSEEITVYGIAKNSKYVDLPLSDNEVYISNAYSEKHGIKAGDEITLSEQFGSKEYKFRVGGIYYYPSTLTVFMDKDAFNEKFDCDKDYFTGYFSKSEISDIDDLYIATEITVDDLTKVSRQLTRSMGNMMNIFVFFGVIMYVLIIYLLSKIIIEKNAQSISMTKILGYRNSEINGIYIATTAIVTAVTLLVTIPLSDYLLGQLFVFFMRDYPGWLPYRSFVSVYVKTALIGIGSFAVIALALTRKIKKVPLADALKNVDE
ncbi:MAG: FtsX-like permease family protein [Ruminiclostridium sp.]|nr:FtsX-like permease family protein [Ruminiclostridium sp.]